MYRTFKPSPEASLLLVEGGNALRNKDYNAALNAYNQIPVNDRKHNKIVQGFYERILSEELAKQRAAELALEHRIKTNRS